MKNIDQISKKVHLPYRLKYYFAPSSHEFGLLDDSVKINFFKEIVDAGFSIYDLSENFRKSHALYYSETDMKDVLCYYISILIYNRSNHLFVIKYFEKESHYTTAVFLDYLLKNPIDKNEFGQMIFNTFSDK